MSLEQKVRFSHEIAEKENARKSYAEGWHRMVVTGAKTQESKPKDDMPGVQYKMIVTTVKPLRDENDITTVVGRGLDNYQCLPFWDESWDGLDFEVPTKNEGNVPVQKYLEQNMIIFNESVRDMLAALLPDEVPARPGKQVLDGPTYYKGEEIDPSTYKECNTESRATAGEVAARLWNDGPAELVDKVCFVLVKNEERNGRTFPTIKAFSATHPVDKKTGELIDLAPIYASSETEEVEAEEESPAPAKKNGASGKPSATAKTVAAAAANKKGAAAKGGKAARK